ncbi:DUF3052 domain-containing protein [Cytophagales bacterium WSM2-2]|nr:DUF3052 domain-containing protein [Cytophagales bacterium WSM2-2]
MPAESTTELVKKLGVKPGYSVCIVNEPENYWDWLAPLPPDVTVKAKGKDFDFVHWFVMTNSEFERDFAKRRSMLKKNGMLWVSWPKKASKIPTDLNENIIRDFALTNGLVDVKVCSVNDIWSGLKLVYRLSDR